jgi:hypothetical protein
MRTVDPTLPRYGTDFIATVAGWCDFVDRVSGC